MDEDCTAVPTPSMVSDFLPLTGNGQRQTRQDAASAHQDSASSTLPVIAAFLRPGQRRCSRRASRSVTRGSTVNCRSRSIDAQGDGNERDPSRRLALVAVKRRLCGATHLPFHALHRRCVSQLPAVRGHLLLTDPLTPAADRPHPAGGVGAGPRIEDVVLGVGRAQPGARFELEEAVGPAPGIDGRRHQV